MIDTLPLSLRPILLQERKKLHWDGATFIFTATDPLGDTVLELSVCSEGGGAAWRAAALESKRLGLPESLDLSCWQRAQSLTASRLHPGRMKSGEVKLHEAFLHDDVLKWNTARWELWRVFTRNPKNKRIQSHRNKTKTFKNKKPFGGEKHFLPSPSLTETSNLTLEHTERTQKPETSVSRPPQKKKKCIAR